MLAFYGWTDHLLLNLLNTKISCFPDEEADLYVLSLPRVSSHLVQKIEETGTFRHVFWLRRPAFHKEKGPLAIWEKAERLLSGERYYRCYRDQLRSFCGDTSYRRLFTGAFWSETLFLFRYFSHSSPALKIVLVEEGTTNYTSPRGWQFRCMPTKKFRERLMRLFYFPLTWRRARNSVEKTYLYSLKLRRSDIEIPAARLPKMDAGNPVCLQVLRAAFQNMDLCAYEQRSAYWIAGPIVPGYEDSYGETCALINHALGILPPDQLLIKLHPVLSGNEDFFERCHSAVYIDQRKFPLEKVLAEVDLEHKLLITRSSSVPLSAVLQFSKCPHIIFTYRLYSFYRQNHEEVPAEMVEDLCAAFPALRVAIPNTKEEFCEVLRRWVDCGNF